MKRSLPPNRVSARHADFNAKAIDKAVAEQDVRRTTGRNVAVTNVRGVGAVVGRTVKDKSKDEKDRG